MLIGKLFISLCYMSLCDGQVTKLVCPCSPTQSNYMELHPHQLSGIVKALSEELGHTRKHPSQGNTYRTDENSTDFISAMSLMYSNLTQICGIQNNLKLQNAVALFITAMSNLTQNVSHQLQLFANRETSSGERNNSGADGFLKWQNNVTILLSDISQKAEVIETLKVKESTLLGLMTSLDSCIRESSGCRHSLSKMSLAVPISTIVNNFSSINGESSTWRDNFTEFLRSLANSNNEDQSREITENFNYLKKRFDIISADMFSFYANISENVQWLVSEQAPGLLRNVSTMMSLLKAQEKLIIESITHHLNDSRDVLLAEISKLKLNFSFIQLEYANASLKEAFFNVENATAASQRSVTQQLAMLIQMRTCDRLRDRIESWVSEMHEDQKNVSMLLQRLMYRELPTLPILGLSHWQIEVKSLLETAIRMVNEARTTSCMPATSDILATIQSLTSEMYSFKRNVSEQFQRMTAMLDAKSCRPAFEDLVSDIRNLTRQCSTAVRGASIQREVLREERINFRLTSSRPTEASPVSQSYMELSFKALAEEMKIGYYNGVERSQHLNPEIVRSLRILSVANEYISPALTFHSSSLPYRGCRQAYERGERVPGVFTISPDGWLSFRVWCDFEDNTGWVVIQRRYDGSVDFDRPYIDYEKGFGNLWGEYWLGLRHIYKLSRGGIRMSIFMEDNEDQIILANYSSFRISASASCYCLQTSEFVGDHTDNLGYNNGQCFSTWDKRDSHNCFSRRFSGGWWYTYPYSPKYYCTLINLNGRYERDAPEQFSATSISWLNTTSSSFIKLRTSIMRINA